MRYFVSLAVAAALAAQDSRFGAQSRLVLVPVTVTDVKGRTIDGLEMKDFVVLDEGRPQKVTVDTIATGVAPIALVVAIQASGISKAVLEKVHKVGVMIQPLVTGERGCAAVMSFSERVTWIQECTNNDDALTRAFDQVRPGAAKSARMLDAVHESIERLRQRPNARRVLLLISESRDRGSETALEQAAVAAQAAGVTVYAATYSAFKTGFASRSSTAAEPLTANRPKTPGDEYGTVNGGPPTCNPLGCPDPPIPPPEQRVDLKGGLGELVRLGRTNTTEALAKGTGGATFPFTRLKGLEEAIQKLGAELHSQYLLSFTPEDSTSGYHHLEVRVAGVDVRVRARPGYWSTQASGR
ncbi:MAG TPA: VWA domain-containing protein [Bryobacteraceae bacterium]|nr:VWA domain-containing protein [Bryobacteraceae bacterium]